MEYVYAALVLHEAGKDASEDNVTAILKAADVDVNDARVKSLVAAMEEVDEDDEDEGDAGEGLGDLFG